MFYLKAVLSESAKNNNLIYYHYNYDDKKIQKISDHVNTLPGQTRHRGCNNRFYP